MVSDNRRKRGIVAKAWDSYRSQVMPPTASAIQVQECKRAFYAGALGVLSGTAAVMSDSPVRTPQDDGVMESLRLELDQHARDVQEGRA